MAGLLLGVHLSIAGGIDKVFLEAERLGINSFQIFLSSPRLWQLKMPSPSQIDYFRERVKNYKFCCVHGPYLLNFASSDDYLYKRSIERAVEEMNLMEKLGVKYYVIHPGSSSSPKGLNRVKSAIGLVLDRVKEGVIVIENLAGEKNDVAKTMDEIDYLIRGFGERVGVCIDTCHLFSAGVDIRERGEVDRLYDKIDRLGIKKRIVVIHANDSKKGLGMGVDRHEHIGKGEIGEIGFFNMLHHPFFKTLPFILETPKEDDWDKKNLLKIKRLFKRENI